MSSAVVAIGTVSNAQSLLSEDFEGGMPSGWSQTTLATDGGWLAGDAGTLSSASWTVTEHGNFAASNDDGCNCNKATDLLKTPNMNWSAYTGETIRLTFDAYFWGAAYQGATETLTVVVSVDTGNTWTTVNTVVGTADWQDGLSVDLSPYAGEANVTVAFLYNDGGGWTYGAAIDNVSISIPFPTDLKLTAASVSKYVAAGSTTSITGTVLNFGSAAVNGFDVTWSDGTNTFTHTVSGNLAPGASVNFTHSTAVDPTPGAPMNITLAAVVTNDGDLTNNSLSLTTSEVAFMPYKVVFGEEATGTWCGWCPRGSVWMDYMAETYPESWIGVAVHNGDPMVNNVYDSWMGTMIAGYPSGLIDRDATPADPLEFEARYEEALENFGVADIIVDAYMDVDRNVEVTINAHFAVSSTDQMRLAAVVIEDNLSGTSSDWAQVNYYSGGAQGDLSGAGHDWHIEPNPVPAANMEYDHVGRELLGGVNGDAGSVPSSVSADDMVDYSYTFTLDADYNESNIHIAGILLDNSNGAVLNAGAARLSYEFEEEGIVYLVSEGDTLESWDGVWVPLGSKEISGANVSLFPNPASNLININGVSGNTDVTVYDARGSAVISQTIGGNSLNIEQLTSGVYTVSISNNGVVARNKITVIK